MLVKLYSESPNAREINKIVDVLNNGGIIVIPTDTLYAFACSMEFKKSVEDIAQLKGMQLKKAKYSLCCSDLSQASEYVRPLDKDTFSVMKECLPGPYTFILQANNNVPRNYQNANKTIGIRVPEHAICHAIIEALGRPLVVTSVRRENLEQESEYLTDPELIHEDFGKRVDIVIDGGIGEDLPSTVIDCSDGTFEIIREGKGEIPQNLQ